MSKSIILSLDSIDALENKVNAIKGVCTLSGLSIRDAKDLVERIEPGLPGRIDVSETTFQAEYSNAVALIKSSGLTMQINGSNNAARISIGEELRKIITYANMTAQYDISRALLNVLETYCPGPSPAYVDTMASQE